MKMIAGAILVLAGCVLVGAAMIGVDIRNSTGKAPETESRFGYYLGAAVAIMGGALMLRGFRFDSDNRGGPK